MRPCRWCSEIQANWSSKVEPPLQKNIMRKKRVELSFGPSSSVLCRWDCVRSIVLSVVVSVREKKTRWTDFWEGKTMLCTTRPIKMNSHWIFPIFGWLIHGARREEKWPNFCLRPLFFCADAMNVCARRWISSNVYNFHTQTCSFAHFLACCTIAHKSSSFFIARLFFSSFFFP